MFFFLLPEAELEEQLCSDYPNTVFSHLVIPQQNGKGSSLMGDDDGKLKEGTPTKSSECLQYCEQTCKQGPIEKAAKRTESSMKRCLLQEKQEQGPTRVSLKLMADSLDAIMDSDEGQVAAVRSCEHCR